jgi:hypothetical protein
MLITAMENYQPRFETEERALLEEPAKVIYEATVSRSSRYRFVSGRDATMANLMKRLLSEHIILKRMASRTMGLNRLA